MEDLRLSKLFDAALNPLAWIWLGVLWWGIRCWHSGSKSRAVTAWSLFALIWCLGATPLSATLLAQLEKHYAIHDWKGLPKADAIVCLGGGLQPQPLETLSFSASDASDRYLTALDLYHRGYASHLVFGGETFRIQGEAISEGEVLKAWVERWGLGNGEVHLLGEMTTTRDECVEVKALMEEQGWERILLVTSAWHMQRSLALFEKAGIEAIPVGCDLKGMTSLLGAHPWRIFPSSGRFSDIHVYLHEKVGQVYYRMRGWI